MRIEWVKSIAVKVLNRRHSDLFIMKYTVYMFSLSLFVMVWIFVRWLPHCVNRNYSAARVWEVLGSILAHFKSKIGCLPTKHAIFRSGSKETSLRRQNHVYGYGDMSSCGMIQSRVQSHNWQSLNISFFIFIFIFLS